jgi:hypothetical protein
MYDWMGYGFIPGIIDGPDAADEDQDEVVGGYDCPTWEHVKLLASPWMAGSYVLKHRGPIKLEFTVDTLDEAVDESEERLMKEAFYMGGNAVLGWERNIHLWETPIRVETGGTCVTQGNK